MMVHHLCLNFPIGSAEQFCEYKPYCLLKVPTAENCFSSLQMTLILLAEFEAYLKPCELCTGMCCKW